uniref:Choline O-acetyltransferase n=1 Tax=Panagrellus redivivus TaxID=6233 RepID=A0A7E5A0J6_PANRE
MSKMLAPEEWYNGTLPKPPVPTLSHTFGRYLEYASVIAKDDVQFDEARKHVDEFMQNGTSLQNQLMHISEVEHNWVNRFWLPKMYLKARYPLILYSNPAYVFTPQKFASDDEYLNYTAWLIRGMLDFKQSIDKRTVDRDYADKQRTIPMCMDQYDRLLTSYREANVGEDILLRSPVLEDEHIHVMCLNQGFTVAVKSGGVLLSQCEIRYQLERIVKSAKNRSTAGLIPIAGATGGERDKAAQFWAQAKVDPMNAASLHAVSSSVFAVCLDLEPTPENIDEATQGQAILHGYGSKRNGLNRWFEHTLQLVVARDGTNGFCIEHSVAEGMVIIKLGESIIRFAKEKMKQKQYSEPKLMIRPKGLRWRVTNAMQEILDEQIKTLDDLANDLDLKVVYFTDFGKERIKSFHVSPDGFVQLSMQLAHYRLYGRLVSTYESASIRRFFLGRVDNIRSATPEALAWVKIMKDSSASLDLKYELFRQAAVKQALLIKENITGYGIDNHLCALSTLANEAISNGTLSTQFNVFNDKTWYHTMRFPLSTSQVSTSPDIEKCYLCYGPVVDDGYGNAYNIQSEYIKMAVSARKSYADTDVDSFAREVCQAMRDIAKLIETVNPPTNKN